jgi:hypothetical protein
MALAIVPLRIYAQSASAAPQSADGPVLEEVTITSQRRVEKLQDVPIAATALAGDQLEGKGVARLADLQFASPALTITDAGLTQSNQHPRHRARERLPGCGQWSRDLRGWSVPATDSNRPRGWDRRGLHQMHNRAGAPTTAQTAVCRRSI